MQKERAPRDKPDGVIPPPRRQEQEEVADAFAAYAAKQSNTDRSKEEDPTPNFS